MASEMSSAASPRTAPRRKGCGGRAVARRAPADREATRHIHDPAPARLDLCELDRRTTLRSEDDVAPADRDSAAR
jgi:hypothetical protein